jgi:hypothetical protein
MSPAGRNQGRATHIHFEVYDCAAYSNLLLTSPVGFVDEEADAVYGTDDSYDSSLTNRTYNANDNIFSDGDGTDPTRAALTARAGPARATVARVRDHRRSHEGRDVHPRVEDDQYACRERPPDLIQVQMKVDCSTKRAATPHAPHHHQG